MRTEPHAQWGDRAEAIERLQDEIERLHGEKNEAQLQEHMAKAAETRALSEAERYRSALEQIYGHFVVGERQTYAPAAATLDMIREEARAALGQDLAPPSLPR